MIPVFWRYLRMPSRIPLSTLLILLAAVLIFATPPGVQAQAGLSGVVTDPSGSAVANVLVTATNEGTSRAREEKTGADGVYKFSLPPGDYFVKFTATGFKTADITSLTKSVTETAGFDQVQPHEPAPAAPPASDALTWHGITLYGAYDVGVGWVSHGLPENGYNYEGASLVNRNGYQTSIPHRTEQPAADGCGHQGQGRVSAWLVRCVQR